MGALIALAIGATITAGIIGYASTKNTNDTNKTIANATNAQNAQLNQENIDFQKAENEIVRQREDTAVQRYVTDARLAGVSPLSGIGGSQTASTTAPANTYTMQPYQVQPQNSIANAMSNLSNTLLNIAQLKNASDLNNAQIENIKSQTYSNELSNFFNLNTLGSRVDSVTSDAILKRYNALSAREKAVYNAFYGITDNMSQAEKTLRIIGTQTGVLKNQGSGANFRTNFEDLSKPISSFTDYGSPTSIDVSSILKNLRSEHGNGDLGNILNDMFDLDSKTSSIKDKVSDFFKSSKSSKSSNGYFDRDSELKSLGDIFKKIFRW